MINPIFERATELQKQYRTDKKYGHIKNHTLAQIVSAVFESGYEKPSCIVLMFNFDFLFEFGPDGGILFYNIIKSVFSDLMIEGSLSFNTFDRQTFQLTFQVKNIPVEYTIE